MKENVRSRCFNMLLYPDCEAHMQALEEIRKSFTYVAIKHDRDEWCADDASVKEGQHEVGEKKKEHYHLIVKFKNAMWASSLVYQLGLTLQQFEKTGDFDRSARYLVHADNSDKAEYSVDELEGNLVPAVKKALADVDENLRVLQLLDIIDAEEHLTITQAVRLACNNGMYGELRRMGSLAMACIQEHNYEAGAKARKSVLERAEKESYEIASKRLAEAQYRRQFPIIDDGQYGLPDGW